ncbi:C6 transcription factor, putative [Talaromyces stipitatus ATCC 10500]|uniref:C6 transcription factor, putative n=1 Tax=Talaromyces stipitatus (strain ATCC 10500 / CBS 375.48 / QM 6759 / NRRL 1006) TaxID=441959 RepID=B8MG93_TALSN|nr:C6 transcription factor, putative [Talaromyces stipitatus ATCC 10500]EED16213.1 C6 transcription factor, putative [Talaromyces stipitatus ATCC 10500]
MPRGSIDREPSPSDYSPTAGVAHLEQEEPPTKRRKTRLACDECRIKKIKCDGAKPLCAACMKKGWPQEKCVYNDADRKDWVGMRQLVEQLQGRIRSLEHENAAAPISGPASQLPVSRPPERRLSVLTQSDSPQLPYNVRVFHFFYSSSGYGVHYIYHQDAPRLPNHPNGDQFSTSQGILQTSPGLSTIPDRDELTSIHDRSTGVSAIVGAVTGERQNQGFHGTSSAATFMQQIREAINARVGVSPESGHEGYQTFTNAGHRQPLSGRSAKKPVASDYVLPPRRLADDLLQTYWVYVYPLYPFLDKRGFMQTYHRIWTGDLASNSSSATYKSGADTDEPTAVCIFNMVLALACQYSDAIEEGSRRNTAKTFFLRAKDCLQFDPLDSSNHSIHLVQAFLLFGQYLQSIGSPHEAWGAIGVATRICHELGFHRTSTMSERTVQGARERETVRRVYHGCVMIDRMLSMNLGRPPVVSVSLADSVPLPMDIGEDCDDSTSNEPAENLGRVSTGPSTLSFFVHSAKLYGIMHKILLSFYPDESIECANDSERSFMGFESTLQIDYDLMKWCRSIPDHLKINPDFNAKPTEEQPSVFCRLSYILWARFLHVRIYLFRPIFAKFCIYSQNDQTASSTDHYAVSQIPTRDMITYRMALQCSILCVKSARELIAVIHKQFTIERSWGRKPSWLFSVLHVYLAAAVLIAIRLRPDIPWEVAEEEIEESWTCALQTLRDYQNDSRSAQRCVAALEFLHEKLPSISQQRSEAQQDQQQQNWQGNLAEFETFFPLDQGYTNVDDATGAWNLDYKQIGLEECIFLDPFNVL